MNQDWVVVAEDGDVVFAPMPKHCLSWDCYKDRVELRKEGRYVKCFRCGASYGSSEKEGVE